MWSAHAQRLGPAPCLAEALLRVVPDAGHSAFEPGIARELVAATNRFARGAAGSDGQ